MIVHLHANCWNEERLLPFFFRYYDEFIDHYFIHDNNSTDQSREILRAHDRVTILPFVLTEESWVEASRPQVNEFWHRSRGQADWVAVCNVDEFFWHCDLKWYLHACRRAGITFLRSAGYQMVSERFPNPGDNLVETHRYGARYSDYDKAAFFNPDAIKDTGFAVGRHSTAPTGHVVSPQREEILLLHYKYLGLDYVMRRHAELNARRRLRDIKLNYGYQYEPEATQSLFSSFMANREEIIPKYRMLARLRRRLGGHPPLPAESTGV